MSENNIRMQLDISFLKQLTFSILGLDLIVKALKSDEKARKEVFDALIIYQSNLVERLMSGLVCKGASLWHVRLSSNQLCGYASDWPYYEYTEEPYICIPIDSGYMAADCFRKAKEGEKEPYLIRNKKSFPESRRDVIERDTGIVIENALIYPVFDGDVCIGLVYAFNKESGFSIPRKRKAEEIIKDGYVKDGLCSTDIDVIRNIADEAVPVLRFLYKFFE